MRERERERESGIYKNSFLVFKRNILDIMNLNKNRAGSMNLGALGESFKWGLLLLWGANDLWARPIYPRENPKAQVEEDYGPSSTKQPLGTAEGSSVLGRPKVPPEGRVETV